MIRDPSGTLAAEYTPALSTNQTSYHYQDLLGSSVEVTSGGLGSEQSTSYNAFGDTREAVGAAPSQFTYLGNQMNPAGKTHNFHARSYDTANGRFLSQDPVEGLHADPRTQNSYGYGAGNPYTNPDPTGLSFWNDAVKWSPPGIAYRGSRAIYNYYLNDKGALCSPINQDALFQATGGDLSGDLDSGFYINNWEGYPDGPAGPHPSGPFRFLVGKEYDGARGDANNANRRMKAKYPQESAGKEWHEIQPVKWGGSPENEDNKVPLTRAEHSPYTSWWGRYQKSVERYTKGEGWTH